MPVCRRCHLLYTRPAPPTSPTTLPGHGSTGGASESAPAQTAQQPASTSTTNGTPTSSSATKCRYHPDMFVCRPHAADHYAFEINDQFMKDLQGWPAKFWDCCGAETADAPGCVVAEEHVPAYE